MIGSGKEGRREGEGQREGREREREMERESVREREESLICGTVRDLRRCCS